MKRFTLIELLIVIVIIAILISMLLPSLYKAKEKAKLVVCSSNLKNLAKAVVSYNKDNNFDFPFYPDTIGKQSYLRSVGNLSSTEADKWKSYLSGVPNRPFNSYLGIGANAKSEVTKCPSDNGFKHPWGDKDNCFKQLGSSYWIPKNFDTNRVAYIIGKNKSSKRKLIDFNKIDNKVLFADAPFPGTRKLIYSKNLWHSKSLNYRRYNTLFLDGHIEFLKNPLSFEGDTTPPNEDHDFY